MINDSQKQVEKIKKLLPEKEKKYLIIEANQPRKDLRKNPQSQENLIKYILKQKYPSRSSKDKKNRQSHTSQQGLFHSQNLSDGKTPFFAMNMTKSQVIKYQSYEEKQQKKCQIIIPSNEDLSLSKRKSVRNKTKSPEKVIKEQINWKPCLPNFIYFSNRQNQQNKNGLEVSNLLQMVPLQNDLNTPQHGYIDVRNALKNSREQKGDQKSVTNFQVKEIVTRLNQWYEKKLSRIESQQVLNQQKEMNGCTFQPQVIRKKPALSVDQQCMPFVQEERNYQKIFAKKLSKLD